MNLLQNPGALLCYILSYYRQNTALLEATETSNWVNCIGKRSRTFHLDLPALMALVIYQDVETFTYSSAYLLKLYIQEITT